MMNLKVAAASGVILLTLSGAAAAQDYSYYLGNSFEGVYAGAYGGAMTNPSMSGTVGAMAGANFAITNEIMAGAEFQGGATFVGGGTQFDALMLGKAGATISPDTLIYGAAGGGWINGTGSYAVGGGAEYIATESLGVRGELLGTGGWGGGLNNAKATVGVVWHLQ